MANIQVFKQNTIYDGSEVIFLSPCDCSEIQGLTVDYLNERGAEESQSFIFKDAHGHDISDLDNLFTDGVYVKVILNVTDGIAYIQNADTNKYLEDRFEALEGSLKIQEDLKGNPSGLAELDENGKVPSSQLPSYVDDVLEYDSKSAFPSTGERGKIYVDLSDNKTYRWSGSAYVVVSEGVTLGETSTTAYRGDRGKTAYDHSQSSEPHVATTDRTNWNDANSKKHTHSNKSVLDKITSVDTALSSTSENPVQNKVIHAEIETLKKSVSDGKSAVANAITEKGVATNADASFEVMAENIENIDTIAEGTADATATASQILTGKTAYVQGAKVTGTMTNQGAKTSSLNCGGSYTIPAGYHNGSGKVTANSLASQTESTATADAILSGETAYVNGSMVTGTMTNNGAKTSSLNCGGSYTIPKGYHNGSGKITANTLASQTSATATAEQILTGQTAYVSGSKVTGTMPDNGAVTKTITPSTTSQSYTIPAGYHNGSGKVTVNGAPTTLIDGDATAENVLSGKKFFVDSYTVKTGTMTNNGAKTASLNCGGSYTIPAGYHNGSGKITANTLASQTSATATASQILNGQTAYVSGSKITGTMPNNSSTTSNGTVPGVSTTYPSIPTREGSNLQYNKDTDGVARISIGVPQGYYPDPSSSYVNRPASDFGNATVDNVLTEKTFTSANGLKITGTMPNNGSVSKSLNCGGSYTIAKGYHDGTGKITANSLASQTSADAVAVDILSGKTAYVNGTKITGTMTNNGAVTKTITPSTSSQSYTIPAGYHDGTGKVTVSASPTSLIDGDATAANVLSGKTFFVDSYTVKTGTMTNNGAVAPTALKCGGSYTIPAGYHNGSGKVTADTLANQTSATATASDILSGKTAWVGGSKLTGTMTDNGAVAPSALGAGGSYTIPAGYHNGSGKVTVQSLATLTASGDATAAQILTGKKAYVDGSLLTGTMANNGAKTAELSAGGSYTIPAGYHNGSGKITAKDLASQTSATATADTIRSGFNAYVNGTKVTGTCDARGRCYTTTLGGTADEPTLTFYFMTPATMMMGYAKIIGTKTLFIRVQYSTESSSDYYLPNKVEQATTSWTDITSRCSFSSYSFTGSKYWYDGKVTITLPKNASYYTVGNTVNVMTAAGCF